MSNIGTLEELDAKPGDVVECVGWTGYDSNFTVGYIYKIYDKHPDGHYDGLCAVGDSSWSPAHAKGDIQIFRIISRASDTPKLWRDMTPEEKGALLLAHHEGKVIEGRNETWHVYGWASIVVPSWHNDSAYRIRLEPKVETVTIYGRPVVQWVLEQCKHDTHKITFTTIDGKPDCASIKMEAM